MNLKNISAGLLLMILLTACEQNNSEISISAKSVTEGKYRATASGPNRLTSNYPMVSKYSIPQPILFKLSLNGKDNEAGFGQNHELVVPAGITEFYAPTLKFGIQAPPLAGIHPALDSPTNVHFRIDFRSVLQSFESKGFYLTATNDTIFSDDFEGLFIAGGTDPLNWIWDQTTPPEALRFEDLDQDSIYELSIHFAPPSPAKMKRSWELHTDLSQLPKFSSPEAPLLEALTNLALEETLGNIREDGGFSAGKEWPGIWTRDISFAAQLSLAYLFPENVKTSLRAKLSPTGRIIQDTGTGGSWPISSDRHVWTLAAWEVYLATGDTAWLDEIRAPVLQALQEDLLWNRDPVSGMLMGETSFEDWREQTYPPWMSPANIHSSHALSTNIIFKRALEIGLVLAKDNQDIIRSWPQLIERLDQNIVQHFWNVSLDAPASYIMTIPAWIPAPHRDLLGESLGILLTRSFAPHATRLVETYPRTRYGSPVISHQLPHSPSYHNKAVWPFVESYALLAAKQTANQAAYSHSFNSLLRSAALFLTHRENYHYSSGRPDETEINSDGQLWSTAGWLSAIYKGLFGISISYDFDRAGFDLNLQPNNPFKWDNFSLTRFMLHNTDLTIKLKGSGSVIRKLTVNGIVHESGESLPLRGEALDIIVVLGEKEGAEATSVVYADHLSPTIPETYWSGDTLAWRNPGRGTVLTVNGFVLDTLSSSPIVIPDSLVGFFSLHSLDSLGNLSLPSQPQYLGPSAILVLDAKPPYFIEMGKDNAFIKMTFRAPAAGNYILRFIYSNGAGPINTGNTCGVANLKINDWWLEQMLSFPHTGSWDSWSATFWAKAFLKEGSNTLRLSLEDLPLTNMNGASNVFRVREVEIVPLESGN